MGSRRNLCFEHTFESFITISSVQKDLEINTEIKLALIAILLLNHLSTSKSFVNPGHHYWVELLDLLFLYDVKMKALY